MLVRWQTIRQALSARKARPPHPRLVVAPLAILVLTTTVASCGVTVTSSWQWPVPGDSMRERTNPEVPSGPLYPADLELLVAVAQAGFWEAPASALVARQSLNPTVRAVGAQLSLEHHQLNQLNEEAADRLNVELPTVASPQQDAWRRQIEAAGGEERDRLYVQLTRAAHGTVYMKIASVRATTQNDIIRSIAQTASEYVARHMALLESTGLADTDSLAVHAGTDSPYQPLPSVAAMVFGGLLALVVGLGTLVLVRLSARRQTSAATAEVAIE